jgi:phosphatidylinositol alpha-1,6-mannosyltransferase
MDTLIKAVALLRDRGYDLTLAIGGTGRDRQRLHKIAAKVGLEVFFFGRVPDETLPDFVGCADIMVMDCRSRWFGLEQEGFGIVFTEAAAAGVPAIAGRSGGSHEAVLDGETGLVVEKSRSPRALADAMEELLVDEGLRADYGARAREVALERFDWRTLATTLGEGLRPFDGGVSYS